MANEAIKFYQKQFSQEEEATNFSLLDRIPELIAIEQNDSQCNYAYLDEVKRVVLNINRTSASGPDGLTGSFYQTCWEIV